jgi:hypothetical protein
MFTMMLVCKPLVHNQDREKKIKDLKHNTVTKCYVHNIKNELHVNSLDNLENNGIVQLGRYSKASRPSGLCGSGKRAPK